MDLAMKYPQYWQRYRYHAAVAQRLRWDDKSWYDANLEDQRHPFLRGQLIGARRISLASRGRSLSPPADRNLDLRMRSSALWEDCIKDAKINQYQTSSGPLASTASISGYNTAATQNTTTVTPKTTIENSRPPTSGIQSLTNNGSLSPGVIKSSVTRLDQKKAGHHTPVRVPLGMKTNRIYDF